MICSRLELANVSKESPGCARTFRNRSPAEPFSTVIVEGLWAMDSHPTAIGGEIPTMQLRTRIKGKEADKPHPQQRPILHQSCRNKRTVFFGKTYKLI